MGVIHRRSSDGHDPAGRGPAPRWDGVQPEPYADPDLAGVFKHELIGEAEGAAQYRVRYFQVPRGGRTARERHPHDHGVVIVAGRGRGRRDLRARRRAPLLRGSRR
jgi:quercetin dioxygenase-like cupin family protein